MRSCAGRSRPSGRQLQLQPLLLPCLQRCCALPSPWSAWRCLCRCLQQLQQQALAELLLLLLQLQQLCAPLRCQS